MHPLLSACLAAAPRFLGPGNGTHAIYVVFDEIDQGVRYVGVTRNPSARKHEHLKPSSGNRHLVGWKQNGGKPAFLIVDGSCEETWKHAEKAWIKYVRALGLVFNMHEGGAVERNRRLKGVRDPIALYKSQHESLHQLRDFKGKLPMSEAQRAAKKARKIARRMRKRGGLASGGAL